MCMFIYRTAGIANIQDGKIKHTKNHLIMNRVKYKKIKREERKNSKIFGLKINQFRPRRALETCTE